MQAADYFINGIAVTVAGTGVSLNPQESCVIVITVNSPVVLGQSYPVKIVLADGGLLTFSAVYGGSG